MNFGFWSYNNACFSVVGCLVLWGTSNTKQRIRSSVMIDDEYWWLIHVIYCWMHGFPKVCASGFSIALFVITSQYFAKQQIDIIPVCAGELSCIISVCSEVGSLAIHSSCNRRPRARDGARVYCDSLSYDGVTRKSSCLPFFPAKSLLKWFCWIPIALSISVPCHNSLSNCSSFLICWRMEFDLVLYCTHRATFSIL